MSDSFGTLVEGSTETNPRLPKASTMETLVKIVASHYKTLNIVRKRSILDVWGSSGYVSTTFNQIITTKGLIRY